MHAKRTSRFVPARVDSGGDDGSRENEEFRERETSSSLLWETPGDTELALGPDYRAI